MKSLARLSAAACVAALVSMEAASALEVHKMTYHDVDAWVAMPAKQLRATLANKTIRIDVTSRAVGDLKTVLGTGTLVVYTAPGGKLLWWTPRAKTVQTGSWSSTTLIKGWELPCFRFDTNNGRTECYFGGAANYKEWTEGNPLRLQAGAELRGGSSLAGMAKMRGTN